MTFEAVAQWLADRDQFLILTHKRPDGDTLGSAAGLCVLLRQMGKTAYLLDNPEATSLYHDYIQPYIAPKSFAPEQVVAVDTASTALLPTAAKPWLVRGIDLAIDHHISHRPYAEEYYVDHSCAACGEIILQLIHALGTLTEEMATPLYVAISTDTGCFVYQNTTPAAHVAAAELMSIGIDYVTLNRRHFQTKSPRRLQLEGLLIGRIHLYDEGRLAVTALTRDMLAQTGATEEDAEDIAPVISSLASTSATITLREVDGSECKVSVRTTDLDASAICAQVGGGGHPGAAGALVALPVDEAEARMVAAYFAVREAQ